MSAVDKDGISVDVIELEVPVINVEVVELEAPVVNVEVTEIRGFDGKPGPKGDGLEYSGAFATLDALKAAHPSGNKGDNYFIQETNETYSWDIDKKEWVSIGVIKGNSANEILMTPDPEKHFLELYGQSTGDVIGGFIVENPLMSPDPEKYFLEIYGQSTGDIIGSLVVNQSPIFPDPSDTFASILGM